MSTAKQLSLNLSPVDLTTHQEQLVAALVDNYLDGYQKGYEDGLDAKKSKLASSEKDSEPAEPRKEEAKSFTWEKDFPDVSLGRQEKLSFYALNELEYSQILDRSTLNYQEIHCYEMALQYWRETKARAITEGCSWPPIFEFVIDDIDF